ncbi:siderophore ferric iron reductase [Cupriavidus campinensis]
MLAPSPPRLHALLATAARVVSGLDGTIGDGRAWSDARAEDIAPMVRHLRTHHPEAGAHYWALRAWGLHIWQPVYLVVVGLHLCRCTPDLAALSQRTEADGIRGFRIAMHVPRTDGEDSGLLRAARQLAEGWTRLYVQWRDVGPLPVKSARRLLADCVLGALLCVHGQRADWDAARMQALGQRWLDAMDLAGECGFLAFRDRSGGARLALARKGCCLHYRRADGGMCDTCPRQRIAERLARISARDGP